MIILKTLKIYNNCNLSCFLLFHISHNLELIWNLPNYQLFVNYVNNMLGKLKTNYPHQSLQRYCKIVTTVTHKLFVTLCVFHNFVFWSNCILKFCLVFLSKI